MILSNIPYQPSNQYRRVQSNFDDSSQDFSAPIASKTGINNVEKEIRVRKDYAETFCWTDVVTQA